MFKMPSLMLNLNMETNSIDDSTSIVCVFQTLSYTVYIRATPLFYIWNFTL